jgi:hypothetical protein
MSLLGFRIGSSAPSRSAEERPSLIGGVLIGFLAAWVMSHAVGTTLGEAAPTKAEGGLLAPSNLLFFVCIEMAIGFLAGLVALRMEGPSSLARLAVVIFLGGMVLSALAADVPGSNTSGRVFFARAVLQACGTLCLLRVVSRQRAGAPECDSSHTPPT